MTTESGSAHKSHTMNEIEDMDHSEEITQHLRIIKEEEKIDPKIINLSKRTPPQSEIRILEKGLKFIFIGQYLTDC
jgi:hypothetical protein